MPDMKYTAWFFFAFSVAFLLSCTKDDSVTGPDGLVKTIDSVTMDPQIGLIPLDGGDVVVVSSGRLVRLNDKGDILWRKPVSEISDIRAAVAEPGTGSVLFGVPVNPPTESCFYACRYDPDGNLTETIQVNLNFPVYTAEDPVSMIRLANGGFAFAMSSQWTWMPYLKILDRDFNLVHSTALTYSPSGTWGRSILQICELPNGDIAIAARFNNGTNNSVWITTEIMLARPDGIVKSLTPLGDSLHNRLSHAVSPCTGGFFAASSTKSDWLSNDGSIVNYYRGAQLAGTMQIDRFNAEGQFTGSRRLTGYPGYGLIHTIRETPDGGYLLCGTAGNNGSSLSVAKTKMYVCKLDANLNEMWSKSFESIYQAIGSDAVSTPDGGILVAGNIKSFDDSLQMLIIRTDANGSY
jgi:Domain of unknown function (DUF5122) beta-propeller